MSALMGIVVAGVVTDVEEREFQGKGGGTQVRVNVYVAAGRETVKVEGHPKDGVPGVGEIVSYLVSYRLHEQWGLQWTRLRALNEEDLQQLRGSLPVAVPVDAGAGRSGKAA